jgi:hypothetical protein
MGRKRPNKSGAAFGQLTINDSRSRPPPVPTVQPLATLDYLTEGSKSVTIAEGSQVCSGVGSRGTKSQDCVESLSMSSLSHLVGRSRTFWCGVVVFVAVGSLTMSLATRYSDFWENSPCTVKTLHNHISPEATRQRLAKDGVSWLPPIFGLTALKAPGFCNDIAPACPEVPKLIFEQNLYNRPPPSV